MTDTARFAGERLEAVLEALRQEGVERLRLLDMTSKKGEGYSHWRVVKAVCRFEDHEVTLWVSRFPDT